MTIKEIIMLPFALIFFIPCLILQAIWFGIQATVCYIYMLFSGRWFG